MIRMGLCLGLLVIQVPVRARPSLETKMMGASGCLEARPNEDRAPLMHMTRSGGERTRGGT